MSKEIFKWAKDMTLVSVKKNDRYHYRDCIAKIEILKDSIEIIVITQQRRKFMDEWEDTTQAIKYTLSIDGEIVSISEVPGQFSPEHISKEIVDVHHKESWEEIS